ncbi:resolvase [Alkalinema pantanalense CENA528]|uniref:resolvase n=1 Tax=Alkalinema pantanalense TaxID=1620705 RepID=UPI003D6FB831
MQPDFSASLPTVQTELMDIDAVQQTLGRSRASVYRYTNTDPNLLNPPYDAKRLNPEMRSHANEPLLFHPNEVARFAKDVLRIKQVTIEVQNRPPDATQELLQAILAELQAIHHCLKHPSDQRGSTSE